MNATITIALVAALVIAAIVFTWIITKSAFQIEAKGNADKVSRMSDLLGQREFELCEQKKEIDRLKTDLSQKTDTVSFQEKELVRKDAEMRTVHQLRESEKEQYEKALAEVKSSHEKALQELKAGHEQAIAAARTALALENEKTLKAREESLKKEAAEAMRVITGDLNKDIRDMKEAFDAQKKTHVEESSSIRTQFAETVRNLKEQTESIGSRAENLANALKGKNKMQGIFGETILENILQAEGLRPGHDYDSEFWLRDRKGNIIVNEDTGKKMRPDFVLHFPDNTDVLIDSKVSLSALSDWFEAETDEQRADAARRNLESVQNHVCELSRKEYQKYVEGRNTPDYVIMFIPNYGAYQLAKQEDPEIFSKAFAQNVLITTEETLIPFLRLIRTAWVQKEQMEHITEIVEAAQDMVERVGIFCRYNAALEEDMEKVLAGFKKNSRRLVDGKQSIVKAARKAIEHGVQAPAGNNALPPLGPAMIADEES